VATIHIDGYQATQIGNVLRHLEGTDQQGVVVGNGTVDLYTAGGDYLGMAIYNPGAEIWEFEAGDR
jgi:hypothetical protein